MEEEMTFSYFYVEIWGKCRDIFQDNERALAIWRQDLGLDSVPGSGEVINKYLLNLVGFLWTGD